MKKFNVVILPYRDMYFFKKYGAAVRDLQIIESLLDNDQVSKVTVVNRPVSIYERILGKLRINHNLPKLRVVDATSWDLLGPLQGRKWFRKCYNVFDLSYLYEPNEINLLIDFLPIGIIKYEGIKFDIVWYDFIDNFSKHNRFDITERKMVQEKYKYVADTADYITGVSERAVSGYESSNVVTNAAGLKPNPNLDISIADAKHDFGFIGFITNKIDLKFLKFLSDNNYSIILHGEFYDKKIEKEVAKIKNITTSGKFNHIDIDARMKTFKVGIIPYNIDMLHDESPLKLYQYLKYGHPVMTSTDFEIVDDCIVNYNKLPEEEFNKTSASFFEFYLQSDFRNRIASLIKREHYWDIKLNGILADLRKMTSNGD